MDQSTLMLGGLVVFVVVALWILFSGDDKEKTRARVNSLAGKEKASAFAFMKTKDDGGSRRKQVQESLEKLEAAQKDAAKERKTLKARLIQADWAISPQVYVMVSLVVGVMVGLFAFVALGRPLIAGGAGLAVGYVLPRMVLGFSIGRRQKKFLAGFPDAMDIIVRGVRSGLPLNDCLKIIAHESPEPVSTEFKLVVQGEQVGVPIEQCLERMYERIPLPEINFFGTVLNIQKQSGGNLGEALGNLSAVLRGRKLLREKIKALSAEAKASAMIVGSLPIVVMGLVTMVQPSYMTELYTTSTGHKALMVGALMMTVGTLSMKKLINFKI